MTTYSRTSPYYNTPVNNGYLDIAVLQDLPVEADDIQWTVTKKYEHRPDLLAYDLYQDAGLWWVFAVRNKNIIKDPVYDLISGVRIYLPKLSSIKTALGL
jgi:hypothetical protein